MYTSDFEKAIINACNNHFPDGFHVGCFFYLNQAWRKHLLSKINFSKADIRKAMSVGVLDLLMIIPQDDVETFGIPYVRSVIKEGLGEEDVAKWDLFWEYFNKTWMPMLDNWNVCDNSGHYKKVLNRTNNGIESYNKCFNGLFEKKPTLLEFAEFVERESCYQAERLNLVRTGAIQCPTYKEVTIPKIPKEYREFKKQHGRHRRC